ASPCPEPSCSGPRPGCAPAPGQAAAAPGNGRGGPAPAGSPAPGPRKGEKRQHGFILPASFAETLVTAAWKIQGRD
ncbi:unnamed protein product, partial [Coccothraustes coccothraustes]